MSVPFPSTIVVVYLNDVNIVVDVFLLYSEFVGELNS